MIKKKIKKKDNVINFPTKLSSLEKEVTEFTKINDDLVQINWIVWPPAHLSPNNRLLSSNCLISNITPLLIIIKSK